MSEMVLGIGSRLDTFFETQVVETAIFSSTIKRHEAFATGVMVQKRSSLRVIVKRLQKTLFLLTKKGRGSVATKDVKNNYCPEAGIGALFE